MKGMATVQLLKQLELHTGRRVYELFDLIGAPLLKSAACLAQPCLAMLLPLRPPTACRLAPRASPRLQWAPAPAGCWRWPWACAA